MNDAETELVEAIEARYLGRPAPVPDAKKPETIAARRDEAARQLYLAAQIDDQRAMAMARLQYGIHRVMDTGAGVVSVEKVGRNKPCPCGSGRKAKWCCL